LLFLLGIQLYHELAQAIDDGTPVIGIHIPMLYDPLKSDSPSFAEVTSQYLAVIRQVQPKGPYQLAGLCLGGMVAYEVGRLLHDAGEEVPLTIVFDAVLPNGRHRSYGRLLREAIRRPIRSIRRAFEILLLKVSPGEKKPKNASSPSPDGLIDLPFGTPGTVRGIKAFADSKPYLDTHLIAFRATENRLAPWDVIHPDMGWAWLARSTQFQAIASDHLGIVRRPHAKFVGKAIMKEIARRR
jgi:thioesterase domain-containing protein